ncbi:hypothetical protein C1752_03844 [Acaryochloris thomasi RCC1774]|uniref:Peptidase M50 domain-containing protein n=1 Tax=Acaryochloris thomasi RCC1774 TaxID=1764569 RepID=A0A2W1JUQ2_9CYAN|nr:site-2 protease family protein [Acaryochloris thomasi]PZD72257.1 hypothetical protein C1752_03844 [Acaryochloris thomasi RCC1774]
MPEILSKKQKSHAHQKKRFVKPEIDFYLFEDWGHWIFFAFSLILSTILIFSPLNLWGIVLLFLLSFSSVNLLAILMHELGHAVAAVALGLKVWRVSLGDGQILFDKRIFGVQWIIRETPRTGFVEARIPDCLFLKIRIVVFAFGGCLGNILLWFLTLIGYQNLPNFLFVFLVSIFMTLDMLGANLLPSRGSVNGMIVENDGLQIIQTIFKNKSELIAEKISSQIRYASENAQYRFKQIEIDFKKSNELQEFIHITLLWDLIFEEIDFHKCLNYCQMILNETDISIDQRNEALDTFVTIVLLQEATEYLEQADHYSKESLNNLPHEWTIKGSRGAVLVERGQIQSGIELLAEVMEHEKNPYARVISASYLALAQSYQGCFQEAREWLAVGREIDPHCRLFNRAEKLLLNEENLFSEG